MQLIPQDLQPQESVPLLLSVYEVVTLSHTSTLPSRLLLPEVTWLLSFPFRSMFARVLMALTLQVLKKINELFISCKALSKEVKYIGHERRR